MRKAIVLVYVALVHVLLVVCAVVITLPRWVQSVIMTGRQHEITSHYHDMVSYHLRMDGNVPDGAVIFIGDSLTQGLCVAAIANPAINYGIGGDTTVGVLARVALYSSLAKASAIVLAIGANDLRWRSNEAIIANSQRILEELPEDVPVVFSAILPVDEGARSDLPGRNTRTRALNADMKQQCLRRTRCVFSDAGPQLTNQRGALLSQLHVGDGVHLNSQGNTVWIAVLRGALLQAQQKVTSSRNEHLSAPATPLGRHDPAIGP